MRTRAYARAALLVGAIALPAAAQQPAPRVPRASQHGTVSQGIGATTVSISYNRPVARGRTLFGGIVKWGKVWCPGADSATVISFSTDVTLNGNMVAAGEYSVWTIPDSTSWTMILSRAAHVFHLPYPEGQDVLRFTVAPITGTHMETLAFYFPAVDVREAKLYLHWGTTIVPMVIIGK